MRIGENPTKFSRHSKGEVPLKVKTAEPLLAATVVYIPRLSDYYADSLDILKASIGSLQQTLHVPYDLAVFDNGSCPEVLEYLLGMRERGELQYLWLSGKNMKKIGAWNAIFAANQADYVYYFDCDILHLPGWYERSMEILNSFPEAATVNAAPVPMKGGELQRRTLDASLKFVRSHPDIETIEGAFTDDAWFREFGASLGGDQENYLLKARAHPQVLCRRSGVQAFVQSWHAQFLARADVMREFFPQERDWAVKNYDRGLDEQLCERGYLRLGITEPLVRHLGNTLTETSVAQIAEVTGKTMRIRHRAGMPGGVADALMRLPIMRKAVLKLHAFTFHLIYNT